MVIPDGDIEYDVPWLALLQNFVFGFDGPMTVLNQRNILDQDFHRELGASHAFDGVHSPEIELIAIPVAALIPMDWRDQCNMLVITGRIR
jgi:hypothetical protein